MSHRYQLLLFFVLFASASGCQFLPASPPLAKRHDFGPRPPSTLRSTVPGSVRLALQQVDAADWLEVTEIHYRLLYSDPTRIRAYAYHRWVAPPSKLIEQRFRQGWLSASENSSPQGTPAQIKVELQRFEQVFDSPTAARAIVQVRVQLVRPGQSPNARGDRIFFNPRRLCTRC